MKVEICENNKIVIRIQSALYSLSVIHKCLYWYSGKYEIDIEKQDDDFLITMLNLPDDVNKEILISTIRKDLIDFNTREIITQETKDIRTLLIAKAFANEDDFDEPPPGTLNDPIGFTPFDFK